MKKLFVFIALVGAFGATTISPVGLRGDSPSPNGSVAMTLPGTSTVAWVKLGAGCSISNGTLSCAGPLLTPMAEVPTGAMDGVNKTFTLSATPASNTQLVIWNGLVLFPGAGDYVIAGPTITFQGRTPGPGDTLIVQYWH